MSRYLLHTGSTNGNWGKQLDICFRSSFNAAVQERYQKNKSNGKQGEHYGLAVMKKRRWRSCQNKALKLTLSKDKDSPGLSRKHSTWPKVPQNIKAITWPHDSDYVKSNHGWLSSGLAEDIVHALTPASSQHSHLRPGSNNVTGIMAANTGTNQAVPKWESSLLLQRGALGSL